LAKDWGIKDVDAWLDTVDPQTFNHWMAFVRPEFDTMERIRVILALGLTACARACGAEIKREDVDPWSRPGGRKRKRRISDVEWARVFMAQYGVTVE
jgi:hypothetical protein